MAVDVATALGVYVGIPTRLALVGDDTVVPPGDHGRPFLAKLSGYAAEASSLEVATGGHIATAAFDVADIKAFLARVTAS